MAPTNKPAKVMVDMVYGLNPNSTTGGCVVQRSFEESLLASGGIASIRVHVASSLPSAEKVVRRLQEEDNGGETAYSRVLIIDGIALLFLREKLEVLKRSLGKRGGASSQRVMVGFVHCPFSQPFYCREPWLQSAVPEEMLLAQDVRGLHEEEIRLFGLLDKIIAVGGPCRSLLSTKYSVPESSIILLEPTFPTPPPSRVDSAHEERVVTPCPNSSDGIPQQPSKTVAGEEHPPAKDMLPLSPLPRSPLKFVSVGTLCPRKGQLVLVAALQAACAAHPEHIGGAVLTLIGGEGGDPSYTAAVKAAATAATEEDSGNDRDQRLQVCMLGPLPHEKILENLAANDAFLLNSSMESWAVAPVEAALHQLPVLSTRVGTLANTLPTRSTIWVGAGRTVDKDDADSGTGSSGNGYAVGNTLASSADWEKALLQFAHDQPRLKAEAVRAVPGLVRRFGQEAAGLRVRAVQEMLDVAERLHSPGHSTLALPSSSQNNEDSLIASQTDLRMSPKKAEENNSLPHDSSLSKASGLSNELILSNDISLSHGSDVANRFALCIGLTLSKSWSLLKGPSLPTDYLPNCSGLSVGSCRAVDLAAAAEKERVRCATVMHAIACVFATIVSMYDASGGNCGLAALVVAQALLLVRLAPPPSPANIVTIARSFIPPAVVWWSAESDFGQVEMTDAFTFGIVFVLLDIVDGALARRSKLGPTLVGAALDVESDSIAVLFLSLTASQKAWYGGSIAGILRYVFVLATGARALPPSPIGPAGRWLAKYAALASVVALILSIGTGGAHEHDGAPAEVTGSGGGWMGKGGWGPSPFLCGAGVAVLCASFSVDFYQILFVVPRQAAVAVGGGRLGDVTLKRGYASVMDTGVGDSSNPSADSVAHSDRASVKEVSRSVEGLRSRGGFLKNGCQVVRGSTPAPHFA